MTIVLQRHFREFTALALLFCGPFAAIERVHAKEQVPAVVPESAEGLKAQLQAILQAAKKADVKQFDDLISNLEIPDDSLWFKTEFGDEVGLKLATTYRSSWDNYQDSLTRMFRETAEAKPKKISVTSYSSSSSKSALLSAVLKNASNPLALYTINVVTLRGTEAIPGVYAYSSGAFRVLNWSTLYQLPNVRPVRIRIGGIVQTPKLIHKVNPELSPDVHVTGVVVLHVVIDVQGSVEQIETISGHPMLIRAAIDAVRQWQYQPTLLNGDPVEVDTTVSVTFGPAS